MIFYFSATGNCKMIGEIISQSTGEKIISIKECMQNKNFDFECEENETIGFISPTYFWGLPSIVVDFINSLNIKHKDDVYAYTISSYGTTTGQSFNYLSSLLKNKGISVSSSFSIKCVDTWVIIFNLNNKEKNELVTLNAINEAKDVAHKIQQRVKGDFVKNKMPSFLSKNYHRFYDQYRLTKYFFVTDNCIGCGLCAKNCPIKAIEIINKKPTWVKTKCTLCLGCLHRCPKAAINYKKKNTHGQFVNKKVKL